jgi:hypothetical protein
MCVDVVGIGCCVLICAAVLVCGDLCWRVMMYVDEG